MTMPSTGALNMGGTTSPQSVNNELGQSLTATVSMNDSNVRTLAGVGGSGTQWSMNSLYGKSAGFTTVSLASIAAGTPFAAEQFSPAEPCTAELNFYSDGTWDFYAEELSPSSGNWATPTTVGGGAGYWIQWTRTAFSAGAGNSATPTSGWQQLSTYQTISVFNAGGTLTVSAQYTINIATDSAGANIVATASFITLTASANP